MKAEKSLQAGSTTLLLLSLLEKKDMYGYEMIEALAEKSNNAFQLKAGTLYPLLHILCEQGVLDTYEEKADSARQRKYYSITPKGKQLLNEKKQEWTFFRGAVEKVLKRGGVDIAKMEG